MEKDATQLQDRWTEFINALDAAVILAFLTEDAERQSATYFESLVPRISEAFEEYQIDQAEFEAESQPEPDIYLLELAGDLEDGAGPQDIAYRARALATISVHSALEAYLEAISGRGFGSLAERIRQYLDQSSHDSKPDHLFDALVEFGATRHVLVHNRGLVDRRYLDKVLSTPHRIGERRPLAIEEFLKYVHIALEYGARLRRSTQSA